MTDSDRNHDWFGLESWLILTWSHYYFGIEVMSDSDRIHDWFMIFFTWSHDFLEFNSWLIRIGFMIYLDYRSLCSSLVHFCLGIEVMIDLNKSHYWSGIEDLTDSDRIHDWFRSKSWLIRIRVMINFDLKSWQIRFDLFCDSDRNHDWFGFDSRLIWIRGLSVPELIVLDWSHY
jgi:hypothetical protein